MSKKKIYNRSQLLNNAYYFEALVSDDLRNKLADKNKSTKVKVNYRIFDAIIPDKIDGLEGKTLVEIKIFHNRSV